MTRKIPALALAAALLATSCTSGSTDRDGGQVRQPSDRQHRPLLRAHRAPLRRPATTRHKPGAYGR